MDAELKRFEEELERLSPESLPEGLIARMEAAMESWHDASEEEENVVPFPARDDGSRRERGRTSLWAAAAGVAILGAVAGLLFTSQPKTPGGTANNEEASPASASLVDFSPRAAKRKILNTTDGGIFIPNGAQPVRVMRFDYIDRVEFQNDDGMEFHVERPAVNYILIPVPTD